MFKMGVKNQLNMFFHMIISYTCDLHLELDFLNLMNIKNYWNDLVKESFPVWPFVLEFQDFEIFIWFIFSSNWRNEHVVTYTKTWVFCAKSWKSIAFLCKQNCNMNN